MITKVEILKTQRSLSKGFAWDNIPDFAVITGINGSGKTHLLQAFLDGVKGNVGIKIEPETVLNVGVQFVGYNHVFQDLSKHELSSHCFRNETESFISFVKNKTAPKKSGGSFRHKVDNSKIDKYKKLVKIIEKETGKQISELSNEVLSRYANEDLPKLLEVNLSNNFIASQFQSYREAVNDHILQAASENRSLNFDEACSEMQRPPPWEAINQLLEKYGFQYRINKPEHHQVFKPLFSNPDEEVELDFSLLSSGEQIIVSLILWSYNYLLGECVNLMLLDEFDAHLNPSMSKMFIEVVKEILVGEFGIQVIMTTHSPSTVVHVDDEELFWMERGIGIKQSSKKEIIPILSDSIMTFEEGGGLLAEVINNDEDIVLITEGKLDKIHIETAVNKLGYKKKLAVFDCGIDNGGADKVKQFLMGCPGALFKDKLVIGLFDYDGGGITQMKQLNKNWGNTDFFLVNEESTAIYASFLPIPKELELCRKYENFPLEFLYQRETLDEHEMLGQKRSIRMINHFEPDNNKLMNQDDYNSEDDICYYSLESNSRKKINFANKAKEFDKSEFTNFKLLFDRFDEIYEVFSAK
tara:strand:- start:3253 stop:5001 length:1749 start_codon:yes stop_codon:yes gene_type:complete